MKAALILALLAAGCTTSPPTKIITLGDSITKGTRPGVGPEDTFAALLQARLPVEIVNVGISGETTEKALQRLGQVIARRPQIVTIMYGTNDSFVEKNTTASRVPLAAYRANLEKLVAELRKAGIQPILMTPPRWDGRAELNGAGEHPNVRLSLYVEEVRAIARETGVPLVDNFARWSSAGDWTTDFCHPNPAGHRVLAETILPVLRKALAK